MNSKHLLFGLLLFSVFGWGQINFEVSVSKKQLGLNERLRVDFKIDKPGDNFRPPKFSSFRVISGPMQSVKKKKKTERPTEKGNKTRRTM